MSRLRYLIIALMPVVANYAEPQPTRQPDHPVPGSDINARFKDPDLDVDQWIERWESESREIYVNREEIVGALGLEPGMRIADVGAGTGLFVEPFAKAVGREGRVYAVDIAPRFVEHIRDRARRSGLTHVEAVLSTEESVALPEASVDVVFLCDTYHHFEDPQIMLRSIHRSLRSGGRLAVIDFERIPGVSREWILGHVRAGKKVFRSEIEAEGFAFLDEIKIDGFRENYFLRFERR